MEDESRTGYPWQTCGPCPVNVHIFRRLVLVMFRAASVSLVNTSIVLPSPGPRGDCDLFSLGDLLLPVSVVSFCGLVCVHLIFV